jgi:MFS transporter, FHS family, Na+ dependent glucose transporter 1
MSECAAAVKVSRSPAEKAEATRQTVGYFAAFTVIGLTAASLGPTLPWLAENTGSRLDEISYLFAARSFGFLLGSLVGGKLYDRVAGHPLMAATLVLTALLMATVPLAPALWLLVIVMMALGAAESAADVGCNTLLVWVHGKQVGPFMNALHFFFGVGALISPIIVAQIIAREGGVGAAYWVMALFALPAAAYLARLPGPKPQTVSGDGPSRKIDYTVVALVALLLFLYVGAEIGFYGWIYSYAVELKLSSASGAAYLSSAFWAALTIGRFATIPVAARFNPSRILAADLAGCLMSVAVMLLWKDSLTAVWVGTFGLGLSMASIFPTALTLVERRVEITGRVMGWLLVASSAGAMSVPWMIGQMFESAGPRVLMLAVLIDLIFAASVLAILIRNSVRSSTSNLD